MRNLEPLPTFSPPTLYQGLLLSPARGGERCALMLLKRRHHGARRGYLIKATAAPAAAAARINYQVRFKVSAPQGHHRRRFGGSAFFAPSSGRELRCARLCVLNPAGVPRVARNISSTNTHDTRRGRRRKGVRIMYEGQKKKQQVAPRGTRTVVV